MTAEQLGEILVNRGIIEAAAVDDPEGYDDERTLRNIEAIIPEIEKGFLVEHAALKEQIVKLEKMAEFHAWRIKQLSEVKS